MSMFESGPLGGSNNAFTTLGNKVKGALKGNRAAKAKAHNRRVEFENKAIMAGYQSELGKNEHSHITNEGLRVFNTTGQAIKQNKSRLGNNDFYQDSPNAKYKADVAKSMINKGMNPFGSGSSGFGSSSGTTGATASRTTSNVAGAISSTPRPAIEPNRTTFISSSNGETSAPSGY